MMINLRTGSVPPLTWVMTWPKRTHFEHLPPDWVWAIIPTNGPPRRKRRISNDTEDRQSWEGYFGTELNLYNVGDVDLYFQIIAYPGITAPDRWPADDASEMDYLFQTGIGWEW
jgi:hypothetical protein